MDCKKQAEMDAAEIEFRLEVIKAKVWARASKTQNWAQTGDLTHVLEMVKETENFLDGKG